MLIRITQLALICSLIAGNFSAAQAPVRSGPSSLASSAGTIRGSVKSGNAALPGVTVTAANTLTGKKFVTSTDANGFFSLAISSTGRYVVRAELAAFGTVTKEVLLNGAQPNAAVDLQMVLLSRVPKSQSQDAMLLRQFALNNNPDEMRRNRGARRLEIDELAGAVDNQVAFSDTPLQGMNSLASTQESTNESVAVSGAFGQTQNMGQNIDDVRDRIEEMRTRGELPDTEGGLGGPGGPGGRGGPSGGPGLFVSGGGPGARSGFGNGRGRFNVNTIHGSLLYNVGNSALDAAPYALSPFSSANNKPSYDSNRFGATVGGPLKIPKLLEAKNTFFFFNMFGTRSTTPYTAFSQVPTLAERGCPASTASVSQCNLPHQFSSPVIDPRTGQAFPGETISAANPVADALLSFIPLPNSTGVRNFVYSNSAVNDSTNVAFRIMHTFGPLLTGQRGNGRSSRHGRNSLNFGMNYTSASSDLLRPFPSIAGQTHSQGLNATAAYTLSRGKWTNNLRVNFNQSRTNTHNLYAGNDNIAALLNIPGESSAPADYGIPSVTFSNGLQGINDITPLSRRDRTFQLNDTVVWNHGKHNLHLGGDYRRLLTNLRSDPNPNGTFIFNGSWTGNDFADFLLGMPAQESVQYSFSARSFLSDGWDFFTMDDFRVTRNLTLNLGLRYEYVSPYREGANQLANLNVAGGFANAVVVLPGIDNFPVGLIHPDRNNWAPRIGIAWKPFGKTVIRAGYGINYNLGQYRNIIAQLAQNPGLPEAPFSFAQTLTATPATPLYIQNGFTTNVVNNTYGVDPYYRLGYVQVWNLNVQREISTGTVVNVGYTGSKGTALDIVRAPVSGPNAFLWETSQGSSILHAGSVRIRKRLQHGISVGGTYTFSKSIDNASSIGGGATVVAQNDQDLSAERGLSSFDQRHRLTGDWTVQLPFGDGRKWLSAGGPLSKVVGNWEWNGSFTIASGTPFTAYVLGSTVSLSRGAGANGSLRANYNGLPIAISNPSISEWFNTAAFSSPCTKGGDGHETCVPGTAGRNTIIGPGSLLFNMSLSKNFPIRDMMGIEIRADASNVFNTPQYTSIGTVFGSPTFGQVTSVGSMRQIKMSLRFRF